MGKAKSKKSCGLDPACWVEKAKEYVGAGATGRRKRIDSAIDKANKGKKHGGTLGNPGG